MLPMSFTTEACPISPQWMACAPMAIITGISSSWTARRAAGHEEQRALLGARSSSPSSAPRACPRRGRAAPPRRGGPARARWSRSPGSGSPGRAAGRMPSSAKTMRPTALGSATQATTTSQASASSRGVRATCAPASRSGAQRSGVRFQTVSGKPLSRNCRAMRLPISPRPANPMRFCIGRDRTLDQPASAQRRGRPSSAPLSVSENAITLTSTSPACGPKARHVVLAELLAALRPDHPDRPRGLDRPARSVAEAAARSSFALMADEHDVRALARRASRRPRPRSFSSSRNAGSSRPSTVTRAPGFTPSFSMRLRGIADGVVEGTAFWPAFARGTPGIIARRPPARARCGGRCRGRRTGRRPGTTAWPRTRAARMSALTSRMVSSVAAASSSVGPLAAGEARLQEAQLHAVGQPARAAQVGQRVDVELQALLRALRPPRRRSSTAPVLKSRIVTAPPSSTTRS